MNYRQRNNKKLVLFFGAVFLVGLAVSRVSEGLLIRAVSPIWRLENSGDALPGEYFVLARPPRTPYDTLVIEGRVPIGAIVGMVGGPLLGTVTDAFARESKVKLFSSSGEKTEAVLERADTPVELLGLGGGNFKIEVPREIAVEIGDRVISSGRSQNLLAVVGGVEVSPTDTFKKILAKSPINIFSIRKVIIAE